MTVGTPPIWSPRVLVGGIGEGRGHRCTKLVDHPRRKRPGKLVVRRLEMTGYEHEGQWEHCEWCPGGEEYRVHCALPRELGPSELARVQFDQRPWSGAVRQMGKVQKARGHAHRPGPWWRVSLGYVPTRSFTGLRLGAR